MPSAFDSVSPSVQSQLDAKADSASLSALGGIDSFASLADFPSTGDSETIYHAQDTGALHRWTGTSYAVVSGQLAIGDTAGTAGAGDLTKAAHDHSQATGNPHGTTAADVGAVPVTGGTFTNSIKVLGNVALENTAPFLHARALNGTSGLRVNIQGAASPNGLMVRWQVDGITVLNLYGDGSVVSQNDGVSNLGTDDKRWNTVYAERFRSQQISLTDAITEITPQANGGIIVIMFTGSDSEPSPQVQSSGILAYDVGLSVGLQSLAVAPGIISAGGGDLNSVTDNNKIIIGVASGKIKLRSTWGSSIVVRITYIV